MDHKYLPNALHDMYIQIRNCAITNSVLSVKYNMSIYFNGWVMGVKCAVRKCRFKHIECQRMFQVLSIMHFINDWYLNFKCSSEQHPLKTQGKMEF